MEAVELVVEGRRGFLLHALRMPGTGVDGRVGQCVEVPGEAFGDPVLGPGAVVEVEHERSQADVVEAAEDGVDRGALLGDEEDALAVGGEGGQQVRDGLALARARRTLDDEVGPGPRGLDDLLLGGVGIEHQGRARGIQDRVDVGGSDVGAHRGQRRRVPGQGGHDVVVGQRTALRRQVCHQGQLGVGEGPDRHTGSDREPGDLQAPLGEVGIHRVGVEAAASAGERLECVPVDLDPRSVRR